MFDMSLTPFQGVIGYSLFLHRDEGGRCDDNRLEQSNIRAKKRSKRQ